MKNIAFTIIFAIAGILNVHAYDFKALVLTEEGGQHEGFVKAALAWLDKLSGEKNFQYTVIHNTDPIDDAYLANYQVFIQLNYPPYMWTDKAKAAFTKYIEEGKGGWVGFHHATLLGEFDGYPMWDWFSGFMGDIRFNDYIASKAAAEVNVEDKNHPVMKNVPGHFIVTDEEWYTFNQSPRPNVHVLASVDESSYQPDSKVKMGDHPVVWTNEHLKARNVYFLMGHDSSLLQNESWKAMVSNAILWAAAGSSQAVFPRFKVLAFFSRKVEPDHVRFAEDAIHFFKDLTSGNGFVFDTTSNMDDLNAEKLKNYSVVMMLNDFPHTDAQRKAFQAYMENGGGWFGFHVAAYNDWETNWPWLLEFLGGGVFWRNNWPPMPAKLVVDDPNHPVTKGLPGTFTSPINEWYQWKPSPRERKNIKVLLSLSPDNYPFGLKDIIPDGDCPVVWTNTNFRMIYMNMGHGSHIFEDATQDRLIIAGLRWVVAEMQVL
jgi:type 1 glutamine amidotransferase